ncbi:MAG: hypothetical protein IPK82_30650 [Polyangiaceae bacterium]|nr:hypothetical protein [Polyangiaceae bacterium]
MARPIRGDVAADKTITMRVTAPDKARFERQIETRAPELRERTMTALILRLLEDSEKGIHTPADADETLLRVLPEPERALLKKLVEARIAALRALGVDHHEARVGPVSVVTKLIRDAGAGDAGAGSVASPAESGFEPVRTQQGSPNAKREPLNASDVHAALLAALDRGQKQSDLANAADIDPGQLARFKRSVSGLSSEKLTKLDRVIQKHNKS